MNVVLKELTDARVVKEMRGSSRTERVERFFGKHYYMQSAN